MKRTALALGLLLLPASCSGSSTTPGPSADTGATPREPPTAGGVADLPPRESRSPFSLAPAGALGFSVLLGEGESLGDDDVRRAWHLLVADPASGPACDALAEQAFTFRGWGLAVLGLLGMDPADLRERLVTVLGPLPVEAPVPGDAPVSSLDELRASLSPAGRLALLAFEETPGHVLRPEEGSLGPASLVALLAEPRAHDLLRALADEGSTLHARVAGMLGLAVLDPRACRAAVARLRAEDADAPHVAAALATALLETTRTFEGSAVGEGGDTPAKCWAFRVLLAEPDAAARFRDLAEDGRTAARLYAACGLRLVDEKSATPLLDELAARGGEVGTFFGCLRGDLPVAELVGEIRTTEFARELAGR